MTSKVNTDELNLVSKQLFNRIVLAQKHTDALINYHEEEKDYNIDHKPRRNSFIDPITVNYIDFCSNYIKIVHFEYKNIAFNLNIYTKNYEELSSYICLMKLAVVACLHDKKEFKERISLKLDLYLTELKKSLPQVPGAPIKKEHAKSGYSNFSDDIYICIYRKEEWFKSFVQELFFAFTIDLDGDKISYKNILSNNFSIDEKFFINNSVVEFCARLFNMAIFLYYGKNVKDLPLFQKSFQKMMTKEKLFAVSQTHKILNHFGLKYNDILYEKPEQKINEKLEDRVSREIYKDECDLFCYFLITSLLFIHQTRIIQWFNFEQNDFFNIKKNERELVIFTHYIAHCSKETKTLKSFEMKEQKQPTETNASTNTASKNIRFCYHRI